MKTRIEKFQTYNEGLKGTRNLLLNMTALIVFGIITGVSLAIMLAFLIEESDVGDLPLIPLFLAISIAGLIGVIMTLLEINIISTLFTGIIVGTTIFVVSFFGFRSLISKPIDYTTYIGMKAIVEFPIDPSSTGRIKVLDSSDHKEFPARSDKRISKNSEVFIEKFLGVIAFVVPIPAGGDIDERTHISCNRCHATINIRYANCPYCGEKIN